MGSALERALSRHRLWSGLALAAICVLAWLWLINGAGMRMNPFASLLPPVAEGLPAHPMPMPDMAMPGAPSSWTAPQFGLILSMWWTMMIAMMLPSAAPTILLYARAANRVETGAARPSTAGFLTGYLVAWGAFSLLATVLHASLERAGVLEASWMASQSRWFSAMILFFAGLYQLTPLKNVCLRHCRSPAQFLSRYYRPGPIGALRMGLIHGGYCIGCCWLLMLLLFVGGVMNLVWIALLTLMVAAEKLLPPGRAVSRVAGWLCVLSAVLILVY